MNEFFIVVERDEIFFWVELRMFFCVFFELGDACLIAFIFGEKFIYFLQFFVLSILIGTSSYSFWLFYVEGGDEVADPIVMG